MARTMDKKGYKPTESQYKGNAEEMYVAYDIEQNTRGNNKALYPKVKRVYIAGDIKKWETGDFKRRTGGMVHGIAIQYEQTRSGYHRKGYTAERNGKTYKVGPAVIKPTIQKFRKVVAVPMDARNIHFYADPKKLPEKYRSALQNVT